jgi:hypothetical protein
MNEETRRIALEDMILNLRALAENYSGLCGVALQLVPDDQNLPKDILAIWEAVEQQGLAAV